LESFCTYAVIDKHVILIMYNKCHLW